MGFNSIHIRKAMRTAMFPKFEGRKISACIKPSSFLSWGMTFWLLAIVLVLSVVGLGWRQGAIRVAFSLLGILVGALLCVPLGKPLGFLLKAFGVTHPVILWLLPPVIAFIVISIIFKSIAFAVHHKVEVHFKYKAGDLRLALWERLNHRLGICLGVVNGVAYVVLISFVIYVISYWTVQMESSGESPRTIRLVTKLGHDLESTGFIKTAAALDRMPQHYYDTADIVGLIYQNSLLEARLSRYPAFLMLGERPDFQALANDKAFAEMRVRGDSASQLYAYDPVQAIAGNPETLQYIWGIAEPNLKDLENFLKTGKSEKFADETILGRWSCNIRGTVAAVRRAKPNITPREMAAVRAVLQQSYSKARMVVGTDGQLVIKDFPDPKSAPNAAPSLQSGKGTWSGSSGNYRLEFSVGASELKPQAVIEGDRMTVTADKVVVVFDREF